MLNLILHIAVSLDGYIAKPDGSVNWLFTDESNGHSHFLKSVDALLMGRNTFDQVQSFGYWPYHGKQTYVFTHRDLKTDIPGIKAVSATPINFMRIIKNKAFNNIWLVGGARLIAAFLHDKLVDEYILSIHPIILGEGLALFSSPLEETELKLVNCTSFPGGVVQIHFKKSTKSNTF